MRIIFDDGGVLECSTAEVGYTTLYVDDIYEVPLADVARIEG